MLTTGKGRAIAVLISLALAAAVALMVYSMRPFPMGTGNPAHPAHPAHPARQARVTNSPSHQPSGAPANEKLSAPSSS
jgi:hypothetical protein